MNTRKRTFVQKGDVCITSKTGFQESTVIVTQQALVIVSWQENSGCYVSKLNN